MVVIMNTAGLIVTFLQLSMLWAAAIYDLRQGIIPNFITVPGFIVSMIAAPLLWPHSYTEHMVVGVLFLVLLFLMALVAPERWIGMGDLKLFCLVGVWAGLAVVFVLILAAIFGIVQSLIRGLVCRGQGFYTRHGFDVALAWTTFFLVAQVASS